MTVKTNINYNVKNKSSMETELRKILNEFRQWQRKWDLYDSRQTLKKPQSSDDFIKGLKSKYVVGFKHCC